ncbi:alpha/beta fold hydrolase [Marinobacteraceae bacterium S3BR75-40.1]
MAIRLKAKVDGDGPPLILLHGLFGSRQNLGAIATRLSPEWQVHSLDLRNHGHSPHCDSMTYPEMAADVARYMEEAGLESAHLLGHSMGGKTAMQLALSHPGRVQRLIVADIAPVNYAARHDAILDGLCALEPSRLSSRTEADRQLQAYVSEPAVRAFLLKNLVRSGEGFAWRMNLSAIRANYDALRAAPEGEGAFEGATLFIKGGESDYIQTAHREAVKSRFPNAVLRVMPECGHWLHAQKPDLFATLCRRFLQGEMGSD